MPSQSSPTSDVTNPRPRNPDRRPLDRHLVRPDARVRRPLPSRRESGPSPVHQDRNGNPFSAPLLGASRSGSLPAAGSKPGRGDRTGRRRGKEADRSRAAGHGGHPRAGPHKPPQTTEEITGPALSRGEQGHAPLPSTRFHLVRGGLPPWPPINSKAEIPARTSPEEASRQPCRSPAGKAEAVSWAWIAGAWGEVCPGC